MAVKVNSRKMLKTKYGLTCSQWQWIVHIEASSLLHFAFTWHARMFDSSLSFLSTRLFICISLEFSHLDDYLLFLRISQAGRSVALLIRKIGI